ncbi:sugar ABC transporter permease [Nesterenkonia sp. YGD6]|uniref:carbohydrate ABC transporter permease n=1 Tax=Nesterenkonia sp. YGD6 TaxID=2901231 RepID=UPI001F4C6BC3|nr:sugar ABC transporter permease [Nesterenkonia sp. YGD6]MCH8563704.1 sugar ABC transporter permease [Nesterenkonia sp. YGD6]
MSTVAPPRQGSLAPPGQRSKKAVDDQRAERRRAWRRRLPLLPALTYLILTTQIPFLTAIIISFTNWHALYPDRGGFAGFDNYVEVFSNPTLRSSVTVTVILTVTVVLVSLILGLAIALLLNREFFGRGAVRTMMITPFLIVPIAAALLWKHAILNPTYGLLNGTITWIWSLFGSTNPPQVAWVTEMPLIAIEASLIWQWTPFMMLILLAGLQSLPSDAIEAAKLDGAGPVAIFRYITLPHLRRYIELSVVLGSVYIVQNFDHVFTMTAGALGTANLPYAVYQTFFQQQNYGLAAALGVVVVAGTLIFATFALRLVSSLQQEKP